MNAAAPIISSKPPAITPMMVGASKPVTGIGGFVGAGVCPTGVTVGIGVAVTVGIGVGVADGLGVAVAPGANVGAGVGVGVAFGTITTGVGVGPVAIVPEIVYE